LNRHRFCGSVALAFAPQRAATGVQPRVAIADPKWQNQRQPQIGPAAVRAVQGSVFWVGYSLGIEGEMIAVAQYPGQAT
jgi:hypothetical protein